MVSLDVWDRMVAPWLHSVEIKAGWTAYYAKETSDAVSQMTMRPEFETRAEEMLDRAEATLTEALEKVRAAREKFKQLETAA